MKARKRFRFSPGWFTIVSILVGLAGGYLIGRISIVRETSNRLGEYTNLLMQRNEEMGAEVENALARASGSPFEVCSDQDIALLRRLTYEARFLKDVGRKSLGGKVCSATTGELGTPAPWIAPDVRSRDGLAIYSSYPLTVPAGGRAMVMERGGARVVVSPDLYADFPQQPVQYAVGTLDYARTDSRHTGIFSKTTGEQYIPAPVLRAKKAIKIGDVLYWARCSTRYNSCVMTHVSMHAIWGQNRSLWTGYVLTGGAAGLSCALVMVLSRKKKHTQTHELKQAILTGKLSVAYQPIVELGTHQIVGAEALARWTDEVGDSIRPETIIALAEAEGFVSEITRFVLTRSLEELGPILEHKPDFRLCINLAPADLADPRLLMLLDERLRETQILPSNVVFELTERSISDKDVAVLAIRRLRERGHWVLIDDFGTGYSNLAYLTELNVDGIKISRSFIATLGTESVTASIVPQILEVAKSFGLSVVVQGIERAEQAKYFASDDPKMLGQGWFFGLPVPARSLLYLCSERSE